MPGWPRSRQARTIASSTGRWGSLADHSTLADRRGSFHDGDAPTPWATRNGLAWEHVGVSSKHGHHRHPVPDEPNPPEPLRRRASAPGYPSEWEADVVLSDGSVAHMRPITPSDGVRLQEFHAGQARSRSTCGSSRPLNELSDRVSIRFTVVDYDERVALVATRKTGSSASGATTRSTTRPPKWRSTCQITTRARESVRSCSNTWPLWVWRRASPGSSLRCSPQNRRMINVFREAGYKRQAPA